MDELLHSFTNRYFQLRRYSVSHSSLLLRSVKLDTSDDAELTAIGHTVYEHSSRIDILFKGVEGIHLFDTYLDSFLKIRKISYHYDQTALVGFANSNIDEDKQLFALDSKEGRSFIVSYGCHVHEDQNENHKSGRFDQNFSGL